jgi:hypothetical protein
MQQGRYGDRDRDLQLPKLALCQNLSIQETKDDHSKPKPIWIKESNMKFEVGQSVTVDTNNYMNSLPGVVLDVSASHDGFGAQYTVDVQDHGTQYFHARDLLSAEESVGVYR